MSLAEWVTAKMPRLAAIGLGLTVAMPLIAVASAVVSPGWPDTLACGDDGNIELFTWNVLHDVQLSSIRTHGNLAEHLGPAYFYLLAPLYGLFGCKYAGLRLGAIAINVLAIVGVLGTARRLGGLAAMLWLGLLLTGFVRFVSVSWLVDTWIPWVVILPFLAVVLLFAGVALGRPWFLPAALGVGSFIVQTQIGYTPVVAALTLVSCVAGWLALRHEGPLATTLWKPVAVAVLILVPLWTPTAVKQICGMPGRVSETLAYFAQQGVGHSWHQAARVLEVSLAAFPASLLGVDAKPALLAVEQAAGPGENVWLFRLLAVGQLVLLPTAFWLARRRGRPLDAMLCLFSPLLLAVCAVSVRRIADGIVFHQVFWMSTLGLLNGYLIGSAIFCELGRRLRVADRPRVHRAVVTAAILTIAMAGLANTVQAVRQLPIVRGERPDPLMHDDSDEALFGGNETDARRFLASAQQWLEANDVRQYRLRIVGLHRCGVATGMILGLTKAGRRPVLDPWHARVFTPRYPEPAEPIENLLLLCSRSCAQRARAADGDLRVLAESPYAILFGTPHASRLAPWLTTEPRFR